MDGTKFIASTGFSAPAFKGGTMDGTKFIASTGFSAPAFTGGTIYASSFFFSPQTTVFNSAVTATFVNVTSTSPTIISSLNITTTGKSLYIRAHGSYTCLQSDASSRLNLYVGGTSIGGQMNLTPGAESSTKMFSIGNMAGPGGGIGTALVAGTYTITLRATQVTGTFTYIDRILIAYEIL
jgi:hypothetical protein